MADGNLHPRSALYGLARPGRFGSPQEPGVQIAVRDDLQIAGVILRDGAGEAFDGRVQSLFGFTPQDGPSRGGAGGTSALGIGPGRWLFLCRDGCKDFAADLAANLAPFASVSDHSNGYVTFAIGGACARQVLAKGVPLDIHPTAFAADRVAVTVVAHIGAVLWRDDGQFHVAIFRSYTKSFWHWLHASAAEFGAELI